MAIDIEKLYPRGVDDVSPIPPSGQCATEAEAFSEAGDEIIAKLNELPIADRSEIVRRAGAGISMTFKRADKGWFVGFLCNNGDQCPFFVQNADELIALVTQAFDIGEYVPRHDVALQARVDEDRRG